MVEERLPTMRILSGWPLLTASATFASVLSVVSRCGGTSQDGDLSGELLRELSAGAVGAGSSARTDVVTNKAATANVTRITPGLHLISFPLPDRRCRRYF